jgi:hypothetical protein
MGMFQAIAEELDPAPIFPEMFVQPAYLLGFPIETLLHPCWTLQNPHEIAY